MAMTSLNISLPDSLKEFVETRTREGGYSTPSEYMRSLVRDEQKRLAEERLESLLLEGLQSGSSTLHTPAHLARKRQQLIDRHKAKLTK